MSWNRRERGFTIVEIIIALGIFGLGSIALFTLYVNNMRKAAQARRQIIISIIAKDVSVKNQVAAMSANLRAADFADPDWVVDSVDTYDQIVPEGKKWDDISIYKGFSFYVEHLERSSLSPTADSSVTSERYGLYLYDMQFVDFDGYGKIYEEEVGFSLNDGDEVEQDVFTDFGLPAPSHHVMFNSLGMQHYWKRFRLWIVWNLTRFAPADLGGEIKQGRFPQPGDRYDTSYFSIYNPDTHKHED